MATHSRGFEAVQLIAQQWVILWMKQDPYKDPAFSYHNVNWGIQNDIDSAANLVAILQDSENGITWRLRAGPSVATVPGGTLRFSVPHLLRWQRILLYSAATGYATGTRLEPEQQVLPGNLRSGSTPVTPLYCASYCEQTCQGTPETSYYPPVINPPVAPEEPDPVPDEPPFPDPGDWSCKYYCQAACQHNCQTLEENSCQGSCQAFCQVHQQT